MSFILLPIRVPVLLMSFLSVSMDLVFVCELDGFQYRQSSSIVKQLVLSPLDGGPPATFTFDTRFLLNDSPATLRCYQYATRNIHGLPIALPGLPYASRHEAVTAYLRHKAYKFLEDTGHSSQFGPRILILTKGEQKVRILRELIEIHSFLESLEIEDLQDYSCSSTVSLIGCRSSTGARAAVFSAWIKGRFQEAFPDAAPPTSLAF